MYRGRIFLKIAFYLASQGIYPLYAHGSGSSSHDLKPGHYLGYLLPHDQAVKIRTSLYVFAVQNNEKKTVLSAIVKLSLGHAASREYISFYYDTVAENQAQHTFNLDSNEQDLTITHAQLNHGRIVGKYRSANGQSEGHIILTRRSKPATVGYLGLAADLLLTQRQAIASLAGIYRGTCQNKPTEIALETSKWHHSTNLINNPLPGYRISGRLSIRDKSCDHKAYCVKKNFSDGTYNFYRGYLRLTGHPSNLACQVQGSELSCNDGCSLHKQRSFYPLRLKSPSMTNNPFPVEQIKQETSSSFKSLFTRQALEGNYYGYLFHQHLQKLQPLKINVQAFQEKIARRGKANFEVSLSAALYFGDSTSERNDYLTIDFVKQSLDTAASRLTIESFHDVILNVTAWNGHFIYGKWISKSFGLVGPFYIQRGPRLPPSPGPFAFVNSLPGKYHSKKWNFELTTLGDHEIEQTESLIFPLPIHGNAAIPGITGVKTIIGGSYDFYANSLALELEDGRIIIGETFPDELRLYWPPRPVWGVINLKQQLSSFWGSHPSGDAHLNFGQGKGLKKFYFVSKSLGTPAKKKQETYSKIVIMEASLWERFQAITTTLKVLHDG